MHTPAMWHLLRLLCDLVLRAARALRAALAHAHVSLLAACVRTQRAWAGGEARVAATLARVRRVVQAARAAWRT